MPAARKPAPNGRADRMRALLADAKHPLTARQIGDAVERGTPVGHIHGSLNSLVMAGEVQRVVVAGRVHFALAGRQLPPAANSDTMTEAARIRAYVAEAGHPVTAEEVTQKVLPGKPANIVSAMMGSMASRGLLVRHPCGSRRSAYTIGRQANHWGSPALPKKATPRTAAAAPARAPKAPAPPKPPRAARPPKPAPVPSPRPRRVVRGPELTIRDVARTLAPAAPLAAARRRAEPPGCALHGIPDANRTASDRIAADIAAFQARGGSIERLGNTRVFKHINASNDE